MHVLGFLHMQTAVNRDAYVDIMWDNIDPIVIYLFFYKYKSLNTFLLRQVATLSTLKQILQCLARITISRLLWNLFLNIFFIFLIP